MNLLLKNLTWHNGTEKIDADVRIGRGIIQEIGGNLKPKWLEQVIEFNNHFLYPGLVNSHDHLEMNLYSRLGTPPYSNYVAWSRNIYKPESSPIREIEKVDISDRLLWGGLKNLISGATTVIHHNPWHRIFNRNEFPVNVLKKMNFVHSLALGKNIEKSFPKSESIPFVIHAAEGTDAMALAEIPSLNTLGLLKKNTVLIHAIALADTTIEMIVERQAAVVWCPASNLFLFGKTAPIQKLIDKTNVSIGTDSTLTGAATLLDEMRVAAKSLEVSPREIFDMVTHQPATIFKVGSSSITHRNKSDLFVTPILNEDYFKNLMLVQPEDVTMVVVKGEIGLLDFMIEGKFNSLKNSFKIKGQVKRTSLDVPSLIKRINQKVDNEILEKNPLWTLIEV